MSRRLVEVEKVREKASVDVQLLRLKYENGNRNSEEQWSQQETRLVEQYYASRLEDLIIQLQSARGRAAYFKNEVCLGL